MGIEAFQDVEYDIVNVSGVFGTLTVGTSAVQLKVGGSNLTNRISVTLYNTSGNTVYWGYANTVTTSNGTPILKEQLASWAIGDQVSIWLIAGSAGNIVRITEGS